MVTFTLVLWATLITTRALTETAHASIHPAWL
jgi:hypothetical protein